MSVKFSMLLLLSGVPAYDHLGQAFRAGHRIKTLPGEAVIWFDHPNAASKLSWLSEHHRLFTQAVKTLARAGIEYHITGREIHVPMVKEDGTQNDIHDIKIKIPGAANQTSEQPPKAIR